jgi:hypothetical protein
MASFAISPLGVTAASHQFQRSRPAFRHRRGPVLRGSREAPGLGWQLVAVVDLELCAVGGDAVGIVETAPGLGVTHSARQIRMPERGRRDNGHPDNYIGLRKSPEHAR